MRQQFRTQRDLFDTPAQITELSGTERQKAVTLLQALLLEAMSKSASLPPISGKKEAGNE